MTDNQVVLTVFLAAVAFMGLLGWVMWRAPVERLQADGTPYPKEPHWTEREDFVGPLEPCSFYLYDGPSGSYTIARSDISQQDIKWFGPDFNTAEKKRWLNKFGYYHA